MKTIFYLLLFIVLNNQNLMASEILTCFIPVNRIFGAEPQLEMSFIADSDGNLHSPKLRVLDKFYPVVFNSKFSSIKNGKILVHLEPSEIIRFFGFVAQSQIISGVTKFEGTIDAVFQGPERPTIGGTKLSDEAMYWENAIQCRSN